MSFLARAFYNVSYYALYAWYSAVNWWNSSAEAEDNDYEEEITLSHIYFRPTSAKRRKQSYNNKELVWEIDEEEVGESEIWDLVKTHLTRNEKLCPQLGDTLELHYTVPFRDQNGRSFRKGYIVPYKYPARVQFPPYSLEEVREYYHSDHYKPGVLSAEIGERDITNEAERWVGPLDNFYADKPFRHGMCVTRKLVVGGVGTNLIIANTEGKEFVFKNNQILRWEESDEKEEKEQGKPQRSNTQDSFMSCANTEEQLEEKKKMILEKEKVKEREMGKYDSGSDSDLDFDVGPAAILLGASMIMDEPRMSISLPNPQTTQLPASSLDPGSQTSLPED
jgi:hypothetical protein